MTAFYRIGMRVQEIAPPNRKGTIRAIARTGTYSTLWVGLDGRTVVAFRAAQVTTI